MSLVDDGAVKPGEIIGMPAKEYHEYPFLGSTSVKTLTDPWLSLAEVKYRLETDERKKVYDVGTLAHALILEGSLDHLVMRVNADSYRTAEAKQLRDEAYNAGLIPINNTEAEGMLKDIENMQDAVMSDPLASQYFQGHEPEVSYFWEQNGVGLKARADAVKPGVIADLKTVADASPNVFQKQVSDLGYYIQAQHYLNGVEAVTGFRPDWVFVAVQKTAPYTVTVHKLHDVAYESAQQRIDYGLRRYKHAMENNAWPGHQNVYSIGLTPWEDLKNADLQQKEEQES